MFRYQPLPQEFFTENRRRFIEKMRPGAAAVFFANEMIPSNGDEHYKFSQNSNFYYLTGIDQEDCILFLFPDAPRPAQREVLFVKQTSPHIQVWEGWKYAKEEAREASGIQDIKYQHEFNDLLLHLIGHFDGIYLDFNEHDRNRLYVATPAHRFAERMRTEYPAHAIWRSQPLLEQQRRTKSKWEVEHIRKACAITEQAFRTVLVFVKPGVMEYEVEAEVWREFIRNGAEGHAYEPIIASGKHNCVLHYGKNCHVCADGELLLMDFGAKYGRYSSDLTRTIPVNGLFSPRQREVYDAVLRIMKACIEMLRPADYSLDQYHERVGEIVQEELLELRLLTREDVANQDPAWPAYKKYFMHGTSHHIGLETHDHGSRYTPFCAGMVFTCEPGIYLPDEGFGIRLENDILITDSGPEDLMASIPLEAADIEGLMRASQTVRI